MKNISRLLLIFIFTLCVINTDGKNSTVQLSVESLLCENLNNPIGIDNLKPHFSWKLKSTSNGCKQVFYEIQVSSDSLSLIKGNSNTWKSGKVKSDESVMVSYRGNTLKSQSLYYWRVRVWNNNGIVSKWSETAHFFIGILSAKEFKGSFISLSPKSGQKVVSPILRKKVKVDSKGLAFLHVNTLGYHEVYINGKKVGDDVLSPAVSQLDKRSLTITYNVTNYIHDGENDLLLWLGQGWFKKTTFGMPYDGPMVRAQLDMIENGKSKTLAVTDSSWVGRESGYSDTGTWMALQFGGERLDGRVLPRNLSEATLDAMNWNEVMPTSDLSAIIASPQICETNKIHRSSEPVSITKLGEDSWFLDMGRVLTGWFKMNLPQLPIGHEIKIEYCDNLNKEGNFESQGESDIYICAGRNDEFFCNKFNHHAYRYVRITNMPVAPKFTDVKALQIYGNYKQASTFECSDVDLNKIHDMIKYTFKCLTFSGYMVDCPHLERAGYGGDGNSSTMALQTMYDVAPTFANWIQTWGDVIREGGSLPHVAPNPGAGGGGPYWCGFIVKAPWRTYVNYNDSRMIERYYPQMKEWFKYVDKYSIDGLLKRWPDTKHRDWYLGDWLAPIGVDAGSQRSIDLVNNCFISDCLSTMEKIALVLGKKNEAEGYSIRKIKLNKLIHKTFYNAQEGMYSTGSPLDMTYPMLVGAVPDSLYENVKNKMLKLSEEKYKGHIACGLVGVPIFTEWATVNKTADFVYSMLKHRDYPGYLYMIDNKATATWEYWSGERSRVHNCYNRIGIWFYQALGGLILDESAPGYSHFIIDPQIPNGVKWTKITKETPHGTIAIDWKLESSTLEIKVKIPIGVTASLCIPSKAVNGTKDGNPISIKGKSILTESGDYTYSFGLKP